MSVALTGFIVGALASGSVAVAVPNLPTLRWLLAAGMLSGAIEVAAWYLP